MSDLKGNALLVEKWKKVIDTVRSEAQAKEHADVIEISDWIHIVPELTEEVTNSKMVLEKRKSKS